MNTLHVFRALGPIDGKSVQRDSMLKWMVIIPLFLALLIRLGVPFITQRILEQFGFDLSVYYPVIISYFFLLLTPMLFGVVTGFLLLDERDDHVLTALQVTPMSMNQYLLYRMGLPFILSILMTLVVFPLSGLVTFSLSNLLLAAIAAAPLAPIYTLGMAAFAENKVQGFALMKGSGVLVLIPIVAYFIPSLWQLAFGFVPTYWPVKLYWVLQDGGAGAWIYLLVGLLYQGILIALLVQRFNRSMHQG